MKNLLFLQIGAAFANQCGKQDISVIKNRKLDKSDKLTEAISLQDDFTMAYKTAKIMKCTLKNKQGQNKQGGCMLWCLKYRGQLRLVFRRFQTEDKTTTTTTTTKCPDTPDWKDDDGNTCQDYIDLGYCDEGEGPFWKKNWKPHWGSLADHAVSKHCAACGKCKICDGEYGLKAMPANINQRTSGVCKDGFEPTQRVEVIRGAASFRRRLEGKIYRVACQKTASDRQNYFLTESFTNARGKMKMTRKQLKNPNGICAKVTPCTVGQLKFQDADRNKAGMYIFESRSFSHGNPAKVQCRHDRRITTQLQCLRGEVLPNYDCPEVNQYWCPYEGEIDLRSLENVDVAYGCVRAGRYQVQFKCAHLSINRNVSYDVKTFSLQGSSWINRGSACPTHDL